MTELADSLQLLMHENRRNLDIPQKLPRELIQVRHLQASPSDLHIPDIEITVDTRKPLRDEATRHYSGFVLRLLDRLLDT
ncbi:hypothetical protein IT415_01085 [bacterium]|nr:hypothetical protein [bacterium]